MDWNESPDFDPDLMANLLWEAGLENGPSEIHGVVTGLLAAGAVDSPEAALDATARSLDADLFGELAGQVMELYRLTADHLEDEDMDFYPLLPDDDQDIELRTTAMAGWCGGFLTGFAARTEGRAGLPEDSGEVLKDFAAIAQAAVGEDEEEGLEESYMELVEYLRFAALNVYLDSRADAADAEEPPALH